MDDEVKECYVCREVKTLDCFYTNAKGRHIGKCKVCSASYSKTHYEAHRPKHIKRRAENAKASRKRIREIIIVAKSVSCCDCQERHPYWAMDFDHRNPEEKSFSIGKTANITKKKLLAEIAKCDVVCALCHRYRTYGAKRGDWATGGPLDLGSRSEEFDSLISD